MTIRGALVKKGSDQTGANFTSQAAISWGTEIYDYNGFFDGGAATRLTVPAECDGRYGVAYATLAIEDITADSGILVFIGQNATGAYRGFGGNIQKTGGTGQAAAAHWIHVSTAPMLLATGMYFEAYMLVSGDASITIKAHSNFGIHVLDTLSTQMILATKSADQTTANYSTPTAVAWNTDVYDTDAIHDTVSNTTKLIIPSALNGKHVIVSANTIATAFADTNDTSLAIRKGGSYTYDGFSGNSGEQGTSNNITCMDCRTAPILVSTGDEFEAVLYSTDVSVTLLKESTFGLRVVDY